MSTKVKPSYARRPYVPALPATCTWCPPGAVLPAAARMLIVG